MFEERIDTSGFQLGVFGGVTTATTTPGAPTIVTGGPEDHPYHIAVFADSSADYTITGNGDGSVTVTPKLTHAAGFQFTDAEFLQFTDQMYFDLKPSHAAIALLYQGALGRTPDPSGLNAWEKLFESEPTSAQSADLFTALAGTAVGGLPNLAFGFTQSQEFKNNYGTLTDNAFIAQLYANVLDRSPDQAGITGWINALRAGHTREWVLVGFVESPEAYHNAEVGFIGQTKTVHLPWLVPT